MVYDFKLVISHFCIIFKGGVLVITSPTKSNLIMPPWLSPGSITFHHSAWCHHITPLTLSLIGPVEGASPPTTQPNRAVLVNLWHSLIEPDLINPMAMTGIGGNCSSTFCHSTQQVQASSLWPLNKMEPFSGIQYGSAAESFIIIYSFCCFQKFMQYQ